MKNNLTNIKTFIKIKPKPKPKPKSKSKPESKPKSKVETKPKSTPKIESKPKLKQISLPKSKQPKIINITNLKTYIKFENTINPINNTNNVVKFKNYTENNKLKTKKIADNEKIDLVITYVNSNNPEWIKLYNNYTNIVSPCIRSKSTSRFRDNEELKYCLRAIDKYINFYRYIYIVINHPPPEWLNTNHPNIKIVYHHQISGLNNNLPTFNSQAIECNLHKIEGLTNEFIYFNDDVFINKKLNKSFFKDNNKVNIFIKKKYTPKGIPDKKESGYSNAWKNVNKILDEKYKKEERYFVEHYPQYIIRNDMYFLENSYKNHFNNTTKSKFRNTNNINPTCSLLQYYYYYKKRGKLIYNSNIKTIYFNNTYSHNMLQLKKINKNTHVFCIEDCMNNNSKNNFELISKFLNKKYPRPSKFELLNNKLNNDLDNELNDDLDNELNDDSDDDLDNELNDDSDDDLDDDLDNDLDNDSDLDNNELLKN